MQRNFIRLVSFARDLLTSEVQWIVEVGARDCRESMDFEQTFPEAQILAMECNPDMLPVCRAAVAGRDRIHLVEKAASEHPGRVKFYPVDPATNPGASSLFPASGLYEEEKYVQREVEIEAIRLDSALKDYRFPRVDLLWMDIQGAELSALKGMGERLNDTLIVHLEVEFEEIYSGQPLFPEVRRFLEANGFRFVGFTIYARHSADAVFVNKQRFSLARLAYALVKNPLLLRKRAQYARHRLKRQLKRHRPLH